MTPLAADRIHIVLEWSAFALAIVAGALHYHRKNHLASADPALPSHQAPVQDAPEEAILEQAKTQAALLREVNHRVKNNFNSLLGLIQMKRDYARSPEEAEHLKDMESRLASLAAIHNMLSLNGWRPIGLGELCRVLIQKTMGLSGLPCDIEIVTEPGDVAVTHSQGHHLTLIINELAFNTVRHGRPLKTPIAIKVTIENQDNCTRLVFADNGPGYPKDILNSPTSSPGAGLQIIQSLATSSLRGGLTLSHENGAVACVTFRRQTPAPEVVPA